MKVDGKLLEKYYKGHCTKAEQKAVEKWLASDTFDDNQVLELPESESKEAHKQKIWKNISQVIDKPAVKVVPLFKKLIRYAAVACVTATIFFVGRYSAIENTPPIALQTNAQGSNNLLVYGGNGTYAKIPGDAFSLQFDGQLKLYNGSEEVKTVTVGDKTYTLEPKQTYILMGDNEKSSLIAGLYFELEDVGLAKLKGDFGIRVLKA
ncbi:hypothetical protein [Leeuwenhoekiella marinoflava]|uniref:hypothetical protein n=1 Tax=Leeuwenhoekiella marinoflava TaxID=988 RepID=UPI0030015E53